MGGDHLVHASGSFMGKAIPRVDLTISTTASMALMLEMIWPMPSIESVPSRSSRMVGCWIGNALPRGGSF